MFLLLRSKRHARSGTLFPAAGSDVVDRVTVVGDQSAVVGGGFG